MLYSSLLAFLLLGAAVAAPNKLEQREPSNAPINLDHALEEGEIKECGGNFYADDKVYLSIQHAVNLQLAGETRGSTSCPLWHLSSFHPAGQGKRKRKYKGIGLTDYVLLEASYPHPIDKDDSKGNKLNFPDYCPADTNRMEYPMKIPTYDGSKTNTNYGQERVVYYWKGDTSSDGNPNVLYCGMITHTGAPSGGFKLC
ncbi:MAG: hypothetical protein Q9214_002311 [Letrouitia sp. 1 TL-2023]